jgi:hypothetical protein
MPSNPPRSANTNEDIHLPAGPIVRIRAFRPGDEQAVQSLLASPEAMRIGAAGGEEAGEQGTLVADLPWGGRIIGYAASGRLSGPRAAERSPSHAASPAGRSHRTCSCGSRGSRKPR